MGKAKSLDPKDLVFGGVLQTAEALTLGNSNHFPSFLNTSIVVSLSPPFSTPPLMIQILTYQICSVKQTSTLVPKPMCVMIDCLIVKECPLKYGRHIWERTGPRQLWVHFAPFIPMVA